MLDEALMTEVWALVPGAREMVEAQITYIHLPQLKLPCPPGTVEALLCIQQHGGYTTRLFLAQQVPGKGQNWSSFQIFGKTWHTPSWNNVPANLRPAQILRLHLETYK